MGQYGFEHLFHVGFDAAVLFPIFPGSLVTPQHDFVAINENGFAH